MVGGYNGSSVRIECIVEAFPQAVNYWERHDGRLVEAKDMKYAIGSEDDDYKTKLFLNITLTESADFGAYYCISKNEKGLTKGAVELYERDPNSSIPPPVLGAFTPTVIGEEPPEFASVDDLCPSSPPCPDCAKMMHAIRCE